MSNLWARWLVQNDTDRGPLSRKQGWDEFVNTAPRPSFDLLSPGQMERLSSDELADYNEARMVWNANLPTVQTPQLKEAFNVLDQVMASSRRDSSKLRGSVVIDSKPALGKTTIATRYTREFHRAQYRRYGPLTDAGHQRLPVAFVTLTSNVTLRGLNNRILRFYGHPRAGRLSKEESTGVAVDCVCSCETRIIVVDELHFVDFGHRDGIEVSNHLKSLANELAVTFVFVGVGLGKEIFFNEGRVGADAAFAQTSRRATRYEVSPFDCSNTAGTRSWVELLATLERHLKLANGRSGMLTDHAELLHRRTQGYIGSLTNLIDRVCFLAINTGEEVISEHLIFQAIADNAAESRLASA